MVGSELAHRQILMETRMESSFPNMVSTNLTILKQVFLNVVSALTHGAGSTNLVLAASGYHTEVGVEAILDITCELIGLTAEEIEQLKELGQAKDVAEVLRSDHTDNNLAVAKIICLDLGWHLEFRQLDDLSGNFLLVVPALRYDEQRANSDLPHNQHESATSH